MSSAATRSVLIRLRMEMGQANRAWAQLGLAVDSAKRKMSDFDKSLAKNRQQWDQVGSAALRTGAALLAATAFAGRAAVQWESAFAGVRKTTDGTTTDFAKIEAGLRSLARTMPESHQEIAAVAEAAGQLGVAKDDIVSFTRTMVMLGDTTNLTSQEAATSIAQFMNIMGTAPEDVGRLGAALVDLGNKGASTEKQIIEMGQRIASAGRIVGFSEANVLSLANAVASTGIEAELGGTAISQTLIKIQKSVATNSASLNVWAETAGMSAASFKKAWERDPAAAFTAFERGLNKQGTAAFETLSNLGLEGNRVTTVLLNLAGANEKLAQSFSDGDAAWRANQALVDEAEKRYDTTAAKIQIAWNQIKDAAIDGGAGLLPVLNGITTAIGLLTSAFDLLPDGVQGALGIMTGSAGVALLAVGGFIKLAGSVRAASDALTALELSGTRSGGVIAAVGRRAAKTAGLLAALGIAANVFSNAKTTDVSRFTSAILDLERGGAKAQQNLNELADLKFSGNSLSDLAAQLQKFDKFGQQGFDKFKSVFGLGQFESVSQTVENLDAAMAGLVQSGRADEAARGFQEFAKAAQEQGASLSWARDQLPAYTTALADAKRESADTRHKFTELAGGSDALAMRLAQLSSDPDEAVKMLADLQKSAMDASRAFFDFSAALELPSLDQFLSQMEQALEASNNWADNLILATQRGVDEGLLRQFEEAGPAGAAMLEELVNGTDEQLNRANQAWQGLGSTAANVLATIPPEVITQFKTAGAPGAIATAAKVAEQYGILPGDLITILSALNYTEPQINEVFELLGMIPPTKTVTVKAKDEATSIIKGIKGEVNSLKGKTITITTVKKTVGAGASGSGSAKGSATGGAIIGPGTGTSDSIDARLSNGEHVWTAAEVRAAGGQGAIYALRAAVRAGRRPRFADGGAASDAWDQSFRSAAAAFTPVQSVPALQSISGTRTQIVSSDLKGLRIGFDKKGLAYVVAGTVETVLADQQRYETKR